MMARCYNAHNQAFASYGGRGIVVAERWHTFAHFLADMGPRPLGHTLDRYPDNNGPYAPDNCRWATMRTQSRNRRNNTLVTIGEITMPVSAWAEAHGMDRATLLYRVHTHWPLDHLFDPPLKGRQKRPH
jgi:hypothetical protein